MIRGAVYRVDLGEAKRGHEQRGRRYGLVLSPTSIPWNVVTIVPTSRSARPMVFRPQLEIAGSVSCLLVDRIRSVDVDYVHGEPVHYLDHVEMAEVEHAVTRYLGISPAPV